MAGVGDHHHRSHQHSDDQFRGATEVREGMMGGYECVMAPFAGHLRGVR